MNSTRVIHFYRSKYVGGPIASQNQDGIRIKRMNEGTIGAILLLERYIASRNQDGIRIKRMNEGTIGAILLLERYIASRNQDGILIKRMNEGTIGAILLLERYIVSKVIPFYNTIHPLLFL